MPVVIAAACALFVGVAGGLLTEIGPWYRALTKPSWQPPDWAFGPAWTLIFILTATSAVLTWRVLPNDSSRTTFLWLYAVNAILHMAWSGLFFRLRRPDWAFGELLLLWLSIAALIAFTWSRHRFAAALLFPYIGWVTFAGALNYAVMRLNMPFGRVLQ